MSDQEIDLGTDPTTDKASNDVAKTLPCAGGCGTRWNDVEEHWHGFMDVDGRRTFNPRWECDPCFMARLDKENAELRSGERVNPWAIDPPIQ